MRFRAQPSTERFGPFYLRLSRSRESATLDQVYLEGKHLASLRVLVAGGGTGGHIIPALAVARELVERYSAEVLFVGTARGLETRLVPEAGFRLHLIQVGPLKNVSLITRVRTFIDLPRSVIECRRLIREFLPHVVFGIGGYASGPGMAAALMLKVPTMAFEPNAMPGLANRLIGKRAQAAAINFPAAGQWFNNAEVTGIPVRPGFFTIAPHRGAPHLLIFGGSQGARLFNNTIPGILPALLDAVPKLTVLHQCGARHAEATQAAFAASGADPSRWQVSPFLDDMPARFEQASLVMARSGASTVAELAAAGKPSLLVPFAAAADEHQKRNAEEMVKAGASLMLNEADFEKPEKLLSALTGLLADRERLICMSASARTQAHPGAAERIAERLASLAR
jgi:UDP-N-acetylglucosamine--N-acetylmuramyl-(pentapeptide) pyrophosphoryl-undecaprenol N-acetylglucosamine transferase